MVVENFGRNLRFEPSNILSPKTSEQIIDYLNEQRPRQVRVIASGHAWSPLIETNSTLIDLEYMSEVNIYEESGESLVRVGAGCQIKRLIGILNKAGLTLPSLGLITEQTIAGAISTGTHGSGKHSLSHYVKEVSLISYHDQSDTASLCRVTEGSDLEAARCSLGCLGIIVEVVLPCVPQYMVSEKWSPCTTLSAALDREKDAPLQQFFLIPHRWTYFCQERTVSKRTKRSLFASIYQIYWFLFFDVGTHVGILFAARWMKSRKMVRFLYRRLIPLFVPRLGAVTDRSYRIMTMEHEMFRHLELELFVTREHLHETVEWITKVLKFADGEEVHFSDAERIILHKIDLEQSLTKIKNSYTHHYPICFRRILADETMISMSSGDHEEWYSISLITYVEPRERFFRIVTFLAKYLVESQEARIHWGKWFPLDSEQTEKCYSRLTEFHDVCQRYDRQGVFRNTFVNKVVFFKSDKQFK